MVKQVKSLEEEKDEKEKYFWQTYSRIVERKANKVKKKKADEN